jgi:hypothetical protein
MNKKIISCMLCSAALITSLSLNTGYSQGTDANNPRTFALGATLLKEFGFGAMARFRYNHLALDAGAGFMPILIGYYREGDSEAVSYDAGMAYNLYGSLAIFFNDHQRRFQNGIRLGGMYNQAMGPGGMVGWVGELGWERFALGFGAGIQYFPKYESHMRKFFDISENTESDDSNMYQLYIGVNLIYYFF